MGVVDPPSWEEWRQDAHSQLVLMRILALLLRQDSEAVFWRTCESGGDIEHWAALIELQRCLSSQAKRWRELAELFDLGTARILCVLQRVNQERPDLRAALQEAAEAERLGEA
jgi:hypothetical protein